MNKEMLESIARVSASLIRETPLSVPMKDACINLVDCIAGEVGRRDERSADDGTPPCDRPGEASSGSASDLLEAIRSAALDGLQDPPTDPIQAALGTLCAVEIRAASNLRGVIHQAQRLGADAGTLHDSLARYARALEALERETALDIFGSIRPRFTRQDPSEAA